MPSEIVRKRAAIRAAYDSKSWHEKVDKMEDKQVFAVYMNLQAQHRLIKEN